MRTFFKTKKNIPTDYDDEILVELVRALYKGSVTNLIASLFASFALLLAFWNLISHSILITWYSLVIFILISRYMVDLYYRRNFNSENAKQFAVYFAVGATLSGTLWGISGVLFFPQADIAFQLFLAVVLFGMGTGSVITNSAYLPAVFGFFPVSLLPLTIILLYSGGTIYTSLAIMLIVALITLSYTAINNNRALKETLNLRFENVGLVKELQFQKHEAEQANIAKSKFLAAASHDLRQPLHALTLFTSVLDESIEYPKVRKVVDQIKASVDALQNLFNALLDVSRLDAGVIQVNKTNFYLQPLLDKLVNDFDLLAKEKGLKIHCPACPYAVHSDPVQLEQILRNYLSNAIRYTNEGDINVTCVAAHNEVTINVIDSGVGIRKENIKDIFSEFHQLSNPERDRSKGLGLGLAIVHRTATLLDHPINVESIPNQGSTFSVCIPQAHDVEQQREQNPAPPQDIQNGSNELIVVVDDEAGILEGMQSLLQQWGYDVICAPDEKEILNLLRQQNKKPDGIIADYRLREYKTGIEVIQAIQNEYENDIPAVIVTGDTSVDELREVNSSGFEVLHKPVAPIKLRAYLRHIQS